VPLTSPSSVPSPRWATATGPGIRRRTSSAIVRAASAVARFRVTITASARVIASHASRHGPAGSDQRTAGSLGAHDRQVEVTADIEPLVGVVEHQHLRAVGQRPFRAGHPVGVGNHYRAGHRVLVHQGLVAAVPAQQDAGPEAARLVVAGDPDRDRRLARPAYREVAHRHRGQRKVVHREPARR
jgi:hypothetical protein